MTAQQKKYAAAEKAFIAMTDLKVGSIVRVINKGRDNQYGWNNHWDNDMDGLVNDGEDYVVESFDNDGITLNCGWCLPFFCLEAVDGSLIRLSDDYLAEINDDGSITVGCQEIDYLTLKQVYDAATKNYKPKVKTPAVKTKTRAPRKKAKPPLTASKPYHY